MSKCASDEHIGSLYERWARSEESRPTYIRLIVDVLRRGVHSCNCFATVQRPRRVLLLSRVVRLNGVHAIGPAKRQCAAAATDV